jgi:MFS family permease
LTVVAEGRIASFRTRFLGDRDIVATLGTTVLFSFGLGVSILTSAAAVGQIGTRLVMVPLSRWFSDRFLVQLGCVLLLLSSALLVPWPSIPVFFVCEVLQGAARGFVWTSSKTHMVRRPGPSLPRLAANNLVTSIGGLSGPLVGGLVLQVSLDAALGLSAVVTAMALSASLLMVRWEHEQRAERDADAFRRPAWRVPGVRVGCLAVIVSAGWLALMNGYVVVMLSHAGHDSRSIGLIVTLANLGSVIGGTVIFRVRPPRMVVASAFAAGLVALGIVVAAVSVGTLAVVAPAMVVSGAGSGALQTFGYALAADAVPPSRRSDSVVLVGLTRGVALFVVPLVGAGLVQVLSVPAAVALSGVALSGPVIGNALRPSGRAPHPVLAHSIEEIE